MNSNSMNRKNSSFKSKGLNMLMFLCVLTFTFYSCHADKEITESKTSYSEFYKKYSGEKNVTTVSMPAGLLSIFMDESDQEVKDVLSSIDNMSLLVHEKGLANKSVRKELFDYLPNGEYNDLMIVKDGGETITFKIREKNEIVSELIMVVEAAGSEELVVISVDGEIPLEKVKGFAKAINVKNVRGAGVK